MQNELRKYQSGEQAKILGGGGGFAGRAGRSGPFSRPTLPGVAPVTGAPHGATGVVFFLGGGGGVRGTPTYSIHV